MKSQLPLLLLSLLCALAPCRADVLEIGRVEATRLRAMYAGWKKNPKNAATTLLVSAPQLSVEARAAGFLSAEIDPDSEMLLTTEPDGSTAGYLFNLASGAQLWALEDVGYTFTATSAWDILRFTYQPQKPPAKAPVSQ